MSNYFAKLFVSFTIASFVCFQCGTAFAEAGLTSDLVGKMSGLVFVTKYKEVSDIDGLMALFEDQKDESGNIDTSDLINNTFTLDGDKVSDVYTVDQVIEERVMSDGTSEKLHSNTSFVFLVIDENQMLAATAAGAFSGSGGAYDIAATTTTYYTEAANGLTFRVDSVTSKYLKLGSDPIRVSKLELFFDGWPDIASGTGVLRKLPNNITHQRYYI